MRVVSVAGSSRSPGAVRNFGARATSVFGISVFGIFLKGVALLGPRVAVIMVSANFPETATIVDRKLDRAHPFCALPAVELRHYQAQREAVIGIEAAAVVTPREHHVVVEKFLERKVGGIAAVAQDKDVARVGLEFHLAHQVANLDAFPTVIEARPGSDAVEVGDLLG